MEIKTVKNFKLLRALKHDYALLGCAIISVISLGFIVYLIYKNDINGLIIFGAVEALAICLMFIRLHNLKTYFDMNLEVTGVITKIWFYKDRGRVTYTYIIDDIQYTKGLAIMKTKETRLFLVGLNVDLLVKKNNHMKAIIKDLYV
ncbi:hypothetical protein [Mariniplasma anaerobium]|uniref:DUF304 domain-containing protein n=1 Tax=Mariniplasma anaerobium TaxID=2735436 RepID=A0A7U9TIJ5_9MOLU|nr:hypothetical protein [Mariniplasma anaerobium]BCR36158.1 hypothetical protein MPAN_010510 [Mariniplasma anaerobium]